MRPITTSSKQIQAVPTPWTGPSHHGKLRVTCLPTRKCNAFTASILPDSPLAAARRLNWQRSVFCVHGNREMLKCLCTTAVGIPCVVDIHPSSQPASHRMCSRLSASDLLKKPFSHYGGPSLSFRLLYLTRRQDHFSFCKACITHLMKSFRPFVSLFKPHL
jgi:hypothetical protein